MNRVAVAVAALVLLSGCNVVVSGGDSATPRETVTPAPVPSAAPPVTPTDPRAGPSCLVPRPARVPTATPPTDGGALLAPDTEVDGATLVARHARALADYSFHLRVNGGTDVWATPGAAAFTYEGTDLEVGAPWVYAVAGTRYSLTTDLGQLVLHEASYDPSSAAGRAYRARLTGRQWLGERVGRHDYEVVGTRTWAGAPVRVLRDTSETPDRLGPGAPAPGVVHVNSTLYVDRHGIVRSLRHVRTVDYDNESRLPNRTTVDTLTVDRVGTAQLHRPAAFCVPDPSAIRTAANDTRGPENPVGSVPVPFTMRVPGANETDTGTTPVATPVATPPNATTTATESDGPA